MKRILIPAPAAGVNYNQLSIEVAALPIIAVNEVEDQGVRYVAIYCDGNATVDEQALAAIVLAHDPTPPTPQPTLEQRLAEALERIAVLEQAQATLGAEVGKVTALGAMSQPIE